MLLQYVLMMTLAAIGGYAFNSDRGVEFSQFLAQHCVNCDISSQWKMAIFDPPLPTESKRSNR